MTTPVALALSPHLDDAAFSCGGTLARLARTGWRVIVGTLFTRSVPAPSGFALACQLDKGLGPEVDYMALRRAEDEAAMAALGATPRWFGLPEAPHRGYGSAAALFGPLGVDDDVDSALVCAVGDLIAECRPALVLAPQAVGGHVDHVQAVRALDATGTRARVSWWVDFPYVIREGQPKRPFADRFDALPAREVALEPADADAKRRACLAYASQLGFQFGGASGLEQRLAAAGEREEFRGAQIG